MGPYDIFISYRRTDSAGHARALHEYLCGRFSAQPVFFDNDSIESGDDFPGRIRDAVTECKVMLALIASEWLDVKNEHGQRRLDDPRDFVRQEIALALTSGKKIIPVLFDDAGMPSQEKLPNVLQELARFDALTLRGKNYEYRVQRGELVELLARVPGIPKPVDESKSDRIFREEHATRWVALVDKDDQKKRVANTALDVLERSASASFQTPVTRSFVLIADYWEWPEALSDRLAYTLDRDNYPEPIFLTFPGFGSAKANVHEPVLYQMICERLSCGAEDGLAALTRLAADTVFCLELTVESAPSCKDIVALLQAADRLFSRFPSRRHVLIVIVQSLIPEEGFWARRRAQKKLEKIGSEIDRELKKVNETHRNLPPLKSPTADHVIDWIRELSASKQVDIAGMRDRGKSMRIQDDAVALFKEAPISHRRLSAPLTHILCTRLGP